MTDQEYDLDILTDAANRLNKMLELDRHTIENVFSPMYVCSKSLSESSCMCYLLKEQTVTTSVLGILIGALPTRTDTYQLAISYAENRIAGFIVVNCKDESTLNHKE